MPRLAALALSLGIAVPLGAQRFDPVTADAPRDSAHPPRAEELEIASAGSRMNALMYVAPGAGPHATVVLLHGYPGNERNLDLAQAVRRAGMNVLFFSYRGAWGSGGTFSFANAQADVRAALRFVRSPEAVARLGTDPARVALVGHSMGGWLAMLGAAADSGVACAGALEVGDMSRYGRATARDPASVEFLKYTRWLTRPGGPLRGDADAMTASLRANATRWSLAANAPALAARPLLLLDNDRNASHAAVVAALRAAGATATLTEEVWGDTDHSFSDRRIALARRLTSWLGTACGFAEAPR